MDAAFACTVHFADLAPLPFGRHQRSDDEKRVLRTEVVGFVGSLIQPGAYTKDTWRESRTVVLPDMQGLGLGPRLSDAVASLFFQQVKRHTRLVRRRRRRRAHLEARRQVARACKAHKPAVGT